VVADVLEHLRDPWGALTDLVAVLRPGGWVVASVPNVRVFTVLLPLVRKGRFEYKEAGVLDRTHLRFFTRSSAIALVEGSGLAVESIERSVATWRRGWRSWVERHIGDFGNEQFLIRAVKK
jgi:2-polyprenyl-3-methyl-5-hydroxy-6-metoxy-1,4-benzoquinol methylase